MNDPSVAPPIPASDSGKTKLFLYLAWTIVLAYACALGWTIVRTAVDIPYWDEWEEFGGNGLILGWSNDYFLRFHNEHRLYFTELLFLINHRLFGMNFAYQIYFNLFLYAVLGLTAWWTIGKRYLGRSWLAPVAFLPLLGDMIHFNHTTAYQNCAHLCVLFFIVGAWLLFQRESWTAFGLALLFWLAAMYSLANGIACLWAAAGVYWLRAIRRRKPGDLSKSLALLAFLAFALYYWIDGFRKTPGHPEYSLFWQKNFLIFLAEAVSNGFGWTQLHPVIASICLAAVAAAMGLAAWRVWRGSEDLWFPLALLLGMIASLALISFARSGFGPEASKASRYAEFSIFIPMLAFALLRSERAPFRQGLIAVLTLLLGLGLFDNFTFRVYHETRAERMVARRCVFALLRGGPIKPEDRCPNSYPGSLHDKLDVAKQLKMHFVVQAMQQPAPRGSAPESAKRR